MIPSPACHCPALLSLGRQSILPFFALLATDLSSRPRLLSVTYTQRESEAPPPPSNNQPPTPKGKKKMLTKALLLALAATPLSLAHVLIPRQTDAATAPATAPATEQAPATSPATDATTIAVAPSPSATPTSTTPTINLAACELAIDTLLREFLQIPTPNAALSAYLATETATVHNGCSWVADAPASLSGAMSAYSTDVVSLLGQFTDLVGQVEGCIATGGATVTRQELVTPVFAMAGCTAGGGASSTITTVTSGSASVATATTSTSFRGFPTSTGSNAGAARATGVAVAGVVGVAAAALFGVVGAL
ncbi:hypothetical protein B0T22DRAFT_446450 [Podospora appendiculata]|uniref:Uncharacterized protein n=1 Tax=Podospora appendiculata TaxID=314037 RepID=A0AAE0XEQ8_9PEZI|nr:hypothetical protein B0T22DRAFT_446450 [Podospora appendiculata]